MAGIVGMHIVMLLDATHLARMWAIELAMYLNYVSCLSFFEMSNDILINIMQSYSWVCCYATILKDHDEVKWIAFNDLEVKS